MNSNYFTNSHVGKVAILGRIPTNSYSNPYNNHDHQKCPHATREDAEAEVRRMKRLNYEGNGRLNVYYNRDLRNWYVGRSSH